MISALLLTLTQVVSPIPLDRASRVFDEVRLASAEDGGRLWGRPLYGPILLVDPAMRFAVANETDGEGLLSATGDVFTGALPSSVIAANTRTDWSGKRWTMVVWGDIADQTVPRRRLLFHELWHRIQSDLGFPAEEKPNAHLESVAGRYWLQLELRALARALQSSEAKRRAAIRDAISFRARRRAAFAGGAEAERALENNEGLAEYTAWALRGTSGSESRQIFASKLAALDPNANFFRSFAYLTGPAYGLLLEVLDPGWTRRYTVSHDLAETLARAAKLEPEESVDVSSYQGEELRRSEERRAAERAKKLDEYRRRFLAGPTLELPMLNARYGFDPNQVVPLGEEGSVHESLEVVADWGVLEATRGAMIASDFSRIIVPAPSPPSGPTVVGDGWTLTLNPGWTVSGSASSGRFKVVSEQ